MAAGAHSLSDEEDNYDYLGGPSIGTKATDFFLSDAQLTKLEIREKKKKQPRSEVGDPWDTKLKINSWAKLPIPKKNKVELFVGFSDSSVRILDLETNNEKCRLKSHSGPVTSVDVIAFNNIVYGVSGSWDKSLKVWNLDSSKESLVHSFFGHTDFVKSVVFSVANMNQCEQLLCFSGSSDRDIRKWTVFPSSESSVVLKGHTGAVEDLKITEDQQFLISCSSDRSIIKWSTTNDVQLLKIDAHITSIYRLFLTSEEIWSASADKSIRSFCLETGKTLDCWEHPDQVRSLLITPDQKCLITGCRDENVRVFNIGDRSCKVLEGHCDDVTTLEFHHFPSSGESWLYTGSLDATIRRWGLGGQKPPLPKLAPPKPKKDTISLTEEEERELAELMD